MNEIAENCNIKIDTLNKELKASEEKTVNLEIKLVELKTEKEIQIEALKVQLIHLESSIKVSSQNQSKKLNDLKTEWLIQNVTYVDQLKNLTENLSSISKSVNHLNNTFKTIDFIPNKTLDSTAKQSNNFKTK